NVASPAEAGKDAKYIQSFQCLRLGRPNLIRACSFFARNQEKAPMSVSLCLMVRNEEEKLATCLQSAADLVNETIVVDTGSTDGTRELAAKLGARVFEFPWVDDFAAARN